VNTLCSCKRGPQTTRCVNCHFDPTPTCTACFVETHRRSFSHWAKKWDPTRWYFCRHDICSLLGEDFVIQLGHEGGPCPFVSDPSNEWFKFYLITLNGIHGTKVSYCRCQSNWKTEKAQQLVRDGFFPGSISNPEVAFALLLLKYFHNHRPVLYQFIEGLRCASDSVLPSEIPVCHFLLLVILSLSDLYQDLSAQFSVVEREYAFMSAECRYGHLHNIDDQITMRPKGLLMVHCPVCPQPEINLEDNFTETPIFLLCVLILCSAFDSSDHGRQIPTCAPFHDRRQLLGQPLHQEL
jgi:hypothetical protein